MHSLFIKTILLLIFLFLQAAPVLAEKEWNGCSSVSEIPVSECNALVALYNSTNGTKWKDNNGWLQTNTACSWHGVQCKKGNVTWISLQDNQLIGSLPPKLGALLELQGINLPNNQLSGEIPAALGSLSELQVLRLDNNRLSGSIPATLGNLSRLEVVRMDDNRLSGEIPSELGRLSSLQFLCLRDNRLSGSLPSTLGELGKLETLWLSNNQLTGELPPELGDLSSLKKVRMDNNRLNGSIPAALGKLTSLQQLALSDNQLTGKIPYELGSLSALKELRMDNNRLNGSIPEALEKLASLQRLDLSNNMLTGKIPQEFGSLSALKSLVLDNNKLNTDISFTLTVNSSGIGEDSVQLVGNPEKYSGKTNFFMSNINKNTVIHLTAPVVAGTWSQRKKLVSWRGCDFMFGRTCAVRMLSDKTVTVRYGSTDSKPADSGNALKKFFKNLKEFDEEYDSRHSKAPDFCNSTEIVLKNPEKLDVRYIVYAYNPIDHSGQEGLPDAIRIPESISIINTADTMRDVEWRKHTDAPLYTIIVTEKCDGSTTREVQPIGLGGMIHEESTSFEDMKSRITVTLTSTLSATDKKKVRRKYPDLFEETK